MVRRSVYRDRHPAPPRDAPIDLVDDAVDTLTQIKAHCRRLKQNGGLDLVVIDYIQLLQAGGRRPETRQQEVSDIARNIKLLAKELEVPVIALSQLNRGPEQRTDKKPLVSDLRESGSIEQDADMVILLHREDARARKRAAPTDGLVIHTRARFGFDTPVGSSDDSRIRDITQAIPPEWAERLFTAQGQGAGERQLQQILGDALGEAYLRDGGRRAHGLGVRFTDVDHADIDI
ncbi:Replicative DNA helicase [Streptomyces sp. AmelKG-D3]|nr:Replicative DNA helicase [Streptomyces sp. AmelKG-D3]